MVLRCLLTVCSSVSIIGPALMLHSGYANGIIGNGTRFTPVTRMHSDHLHSTTHSQHLYVIFSHLSRGLLTLITVLTRIYGEELSKHNGHELGLCWYHHRYDCIRLPDGSHRPQVWNGEPLWVIFDYGPFLRPNSDGCLLYRRVLLGVIRYVIRCQAQRRGATVHAQCMQVSLCASFVPQETPHLVTQVSSWYRDRC